MIEWQPFETAPKDGSHILLNTRYGPIVAWWADIDAGDKRWVDDYEPRFCWIGHSDGKNDALFLRLDYLEPSHWMPLPEPPRSERTGA